MTPLGKTLSMEKCTHPTKCSFLYSRTCLLYNFKIDLVKKDICTHRHTHNWRERGRVSYDGFDVVVFKCKDCKVKYSEVEKVK